MPGSVVKWDEDWRRTNACTGKRKERHKREWERFLPRRVQFGRQCDSGNELGRFLQLHKPNVLLGIISGPRNVNQMSIVLGRREIESQLSFLVLVFSKQYHFIFSDFQTCLSGERWAGSIDVFPSSLWDWPDSDTGSAISNKSPREILPHLPFSKPANFINCREFYFYGALSPLVGQTTVFYSKNI